MVFHYHTRTLPINVVHMDDGMKVVTVNEDVLILKLIMKMIMMKQLVHPALPLQSDFTSLSPTSGVIKSTGWLMKAYSILLYRISVKSTLSVDNDDDIF